MNRTQKRLLKIISKALSDNQADEFVYEWEWEMQFMPTQTIHINDKAIHPDFDIYFEWGQDDLTELEKLGYIERMEVSKIEDRLFIRYRKL
jgi:hypothetical protein